MGRTNNHNYGLDLLRTYMCLMVVCIHYWDSSRCVHPIIYLLSGIRFYAVPSFMLMSFFLVQQNLLRHENEWIKRRFERLLIPQIGWTVIYWGCFRTFDDVFETHFLDKNCFWWQLFLGHSPRLNQTMWFQIVLIWITIIFLIVIKLFPKKQEMVFIGLACLSYLVSYSGILYLSLEKLRTEVAYPIGRMVEIIPLAVAGYFIGSKQVLKRIEGIKKAIFVGGAVLYFINTEYGLFSPVDGFGEQGVHKLVFSIFFVAIAYHLPVDRCSDRIKKIIKQSSKYTMGIYCGHRLVGTVFDSIINHWELRIPSHTFLECITIYATTYTMCMFGEMLFKKTRVREMFD